MFHFPAVNDFLADIRRVSMYEGNCGRSITRVIGRHFTDDVARFVLQLPSEMAPLAFAGCVEAATKAITMHNDDARVWDIPAKYALAAVDFARRELTLTVSADIPQTVRERKKLLSEIGRAVEAITWRMSSLANGEEEILGELFQDDPEHDTPQERQNLLDLFNRLVGGEMGLVQTAPLSLVYYAGLVNRAVCQEIDRVTQAMEEREKDALILS